MDTKNTPPPMPAITEIAPDSSPSISNKEISEKDNSIGNKITHSSKIFLIIRKRIYIIELLEKSIIKL